MFQDKRRQFSIQKRNSIEYFSSDVRKWFDRPMKNFLTQQELDVNGLSAEIIEQPFFDDISPRNVTTVVDDTVVLKCRVKNKGNRTQD
ncbi:hypothetical protein Bhyg_06909 [Pseudolycoriella hygida]|uniref:Uncharacterized protein n=1 Tax=Pseudolycoriella hygida TaxID=35572 RepID=A0A9Q0N3J4_9DIPT|nr:hypothetical protein Bhyg_06909 [Pseudolycoriella hygida]